ncbi:NAD(P)H-quinone oxidoreductase [Sphingobacterium sp. UT-1RO-CII-1]|uniref:NAD(P)H-quinone oxidoreductase n=1 Tax=Sphingobacterium sp. UT-1RO-CII-1 TaxID=2995225 RepID=UPI00227C915C|nr:NAD(P)H-quinone oxidoreductase [Sphingobacterium sp. UT-1RO-CII-1]MCY4780436.1 NAD(P)H-quinone oxidoreductase [Sphingobacterium sp. UT-1RO-CII-1]
MKAVVITKSGRPEVLEVKERPIPRIGDHEVLLKVHAAGVNRPDIFQRKGNYSAPSGVSKDIPGLEAAGMVERVGAAVTQWKPGDKVCCLVAGGAYAEFVAVDENLCLPVPENFSYAEAAGLPETIFTVWDNVFRRGGLKKGDGILVHGGAGGIGSATIQLAKAFGAKVFTTVSTTDKELFCKKLGADVIINYKNDDFMECLSGETVNVVLDSIGGAYFEKHIDLLADDGKLIQINAMQGAKVDVNLMKIMHKRIVLTGSTLRARQLDFKKQLAQDVFNYVWPLIGKRYKQHIYAELSFDHAPTAHKMMEQGEVLGKLILVP